MEYITLEPSSLSAEQYNATYSCTLTNTWSRETHPILYNTIERKSPHWSSPVLVTHAPDYRLWEDGELASPGVELVAESGATDAIRDEILEAQNSGFVGDMDIGFDQFNKKAKNQTFEDVALTPDFPVLSSITMMAPSPDWFTGIPGFSPIDSIDGVWYDFFEVATYPWDAGTETGTAYSLNNDAEEPQKPIQQLTDGILFNPSAKTVLPVALWSCTLQDSVRYNAENDSDFSNDFDDNENGSCFNYFEVCTNPSDCCSKNCVRGHCRGRSRRKGGSRESLRLSNRGTDDVGGAAGRNPRTGLMIGDAKELMEEVREGWLRRSGEIAS